MVSLCGLDSQSVVQLGRGEEDKRCFVLLLEVAEWGYSRLALRPVRRMLGSRR
jgi:hypothetical protein